VLRLEIKEPVHLKIKRGDLAEGIIAVGDPNRAKVFSSSILEEPRLINENRGLYAYTGKFKGKEISIVAHGMGMPSAMIVFEELHMLGAKRIIRVGTTGSLRRDVGIGDAVVATSAGHFNSSSLRQYSGGEIILPNSFTHTLTEPLSRSLGSRGLRVHVGPVISSDAFYAEDESLAEKLSNLGFYSIEMECAGLAAIGWMRGIETACVLYVTDSLVDGAKGLLGAERVNTDMVKIGEAVAEVLASL